MVLEKRDSPGEVEDPGKQRRRKALRDLACSVANTIITLLLFAG